MVKATVRKTVFQPRNCRFESCHLRQRLTMIIKNNPIVSHFVTFVKSSYSPTSLYQAKFPPHLEIAS